VYTYSPRYSEGWSRRITWVKPVVQAGPISKTNSYSYKYSIINISPTSPEYARGHMKRCRSHQQNTSPHHPRFSAHLFFVVMCMNKTEKKKKLVRCLLCVCVCVCVCVCARARARSQCWWCWKSHVPTMYSTTELLHPRPSKGLCDSVTNSKLAEKGNAPVAIILFLGYIKTVKNKAQTPYPSQSGTQITRSCVMSCSGTQSCSEDTHAPVPWGFHAKEGKTDPWLGPQ
jgi:hypothetical protein